MFLLCWSLCRDQTSLLFGFFPHKKSNVFQAKQQPLSKVMGATWPEWGRRALLDVLPIETCSVTYQRALQSPAYSMFKCCVNTASALPFIFVSPLPWRCQTMLGAAGRGEPGAGTGALLPAGGGKRSGGERRPRWWEAGPAVHRARLSRLP